MLRSLEITVLHLFGNERLRGTFVDGHPRSLEYLRIQDYEEHYTACKNIKGNFDHWCKQQHYCFFYAVYDAHTTQTISSYLIKTLCIICYNRVQNMITYTMDVSLLNYRLCINVWVFNQIIRRLSTI